MSDASDPTQSPTGQTQPGWYPDPTSNNALRWWDGQTWGAYQQGAAGAAPIAAAGTPVANPTQSASYAHYLGAGLLFLTCGSAGWLGPLIIFLTSGQNDPFVKDQAAEALNFQITVVIALIVSAVMMAVLIGFIIYPIIWLVGCILPLMGGGAAAKGEYYRYPVSIRVVKGA